jgi:hypothetical protein
MKNRAAFSTKERSEILGRNMHCCTKIRVMVILLVSCLMLSGNVLLPQKYAKVKLVPVKTTWIKKLYTLLKLHKTR